MLSKERQNCIMEMMAVQDTVRITELTERFNVSVATIRRDLDELEKQQSIERIYGGATLLDKKSNRLPAFQHRTAQSMRAKMAIGKAAASLIKSGDTVMIDIGTTTMEIAKQVKNLSTITVLSNSLPVLDELSDSLVEVYSLGGRLRHQERALCGGMAITSLGNFFVDKAFIGAGGVTLENGVTYYNPDSAQLSAAIVQRAKEVILCADSSKFGSNGFSLVCSLDRITMIITDTGLPEAFAKSIRDLGINLMMVEA